jgi:hypothetical protein
MEWQALAGLRVLECGEMVGAAYATKLPPISAPRWSDRIARDDPVARHGLFPAARPIPSAAVSIFI